jgi:2-methylcitrate dehydratase PrpD
MLQGIMRANNLRHDDIQSIHVTVPPVVVSAYGDVSRWADWPVKDGIHSQYSVCYNLACAALNVPTGPVWQLPETLEQEDLVEFTKKISFAVDAKCEEKMAEYLKSGRPLGRLMTQVHYSIEVATRKGTYTDTAEYIFGDSYDRAHALPRQGLVDKFHANTSPVLPKRLRDEAVDAIQSLEGCSSVPDLVKMLVPVR